MLVLSRKVEEKIIIGHGQIEVMVVGIDYQRGEVRLGITAPKEMAINREEVENKFHRMTREPYQAPEDDQPLLEKMEDERNGQ